MDLNKWAELGMSFEFKDGSVLRYDPRFRQWILSDKDITQESHYYEPENNLVLESLLIRWAMEWLASKVNRYVLKWRSGYYPYGPGYVMELYQKDNCVDSFDGKTELEALYAAVVAVKESEAKP